MKTIWKFSLGMAPEQPIEMPDGARILCVQVQNETPNLWALVDDDCPLRERVIEIRGTGHQCDGVGDYLGTFQQFDGALVFHVFDRGWLA